MGIVVGLTGGIASGKSTVSEMLRQCGALIIDADILAREVVRPDMPASREIRQLLGSAAFRADGNLDRAAVASIVFSDKQLRKKLEAIIHPHVIRRMRAETEHRRRSDPDAVIVQDVPLLLETGMERELQTVIVVYVPQNVQLQRLMQRDALSQSQALARIAAQMSLEEKRALADIVIDNSDSLEHTRTQVESIYRKLARRTGCN